MALNLLRPAPFLSALAFAALLTPIGASAQSDDDDILVLDEEDAPAAAGPKKKLGVVPLVPVGTAEKALAEQVTSGVLSELKAGPFEIVTLSLSSAGGGGGGGGADLGAGKSELERAKKKAERARAFLDRLNFRKAASEYRAALALFEKAAPALVDITPVLDAHLGLAEIHARQGEEESTEAALAEVARLAPEHELDAGRFPPLFIRTHAQVRARALKEEPGALLVDRTAVGAEVRLDGRVVGTAPVRILGVPAGRHYVRVYREGEGLFGAVVDVQSGGEEVVTPGFSKLEAESPLELLANNRFTPDAARQVAEAARAAGVDVAVVGVVGRSELAVPTVLLGIDPKSGSAARIGPLEFDGDLLNLSIEGLKAREALEKLASGDGYGAVSEEPLVPGVKAAAAVEIAEVQLRFDVKAPAPERRGPRVIGATEDPDDGDKPERRLALKGGQSGRTKSLRDDDDPYKSTTRERRKELVDEDAPLMEQPWFWPVAIGGGVAGAAVLVGGGAVGLVAAGVLPDPRPRNGMQVRVVLPE